MHYNRFEQGERNIQTFLKPSILGVGSESTGRLLALERSFSALVLAVLRCSWTQCHILLLANVGKKVVLAGFHSALRIMNI